MAARYGRFAPIRGPRCRPARNCEVGRMHTILLTGFGPFPGAPFNPTGPLVRELARRRHGRCAGVRRVAHVFPTSYDAVDRELPELIKREAPDILVMFGVAQRTRHLRLETRA